MKFIPIVILITIVFSSCYYDKKEEIYPQNLANVCDTSSITYSGTVSVIMVSNCSTVGCHVGTFPAAGILLDNYTSVKSYADNGQLMGSIKHLAGYFQMPKSAQKLTDCQIAQLDAWINSGALNN